MVHAFLFLPWVADVIQIPTDATTEQRMISAAVFSTLNEAWDKFKTDNNL